MKTLKLLILITLLSSCATVKKNGYYQTRRYQYGKHIIKDVKGRSQKSPYIEKSFNPEKSTIQLKECPVTIPPVLLGESFQSISPLPLSPEKPVSSQSLSTSSDSCDIIILKDSSSISCRITEMTLEGYHYSTCPEANVGFVGREEIREIVFADGRVERFNEGLDMVGNTETRKLDNGKGALALLAAIAAAWLLAVFFWALGGPEL